MKNLRVAVLVGMLSAIVACRSGASAPTHDPEADKAAIGATLDAYAAAWKMSDAQRLGQLYTDDAVILPGDHVAETGRAAIIKYNQDFFDAYVPKTFDISPQQTEISGDLGYSSGTFSFSAEAKDPAGKSVSDHGKYVVIMKRQADGSWKWTRDIDNSDGSSTPQTATTKP